MAGPIAIAGGFLGGIEHRSADEGFVRGDRRPVFGSFILLGLEILNTDPKAYLGEPQAAWCSSRRSSAASWALGAPTARARGRRGA